ncbi:MAG: hypothetical protein ABI880_08335 [Acidobacteriota bacterium]
MTLLRRIESEFRELPGLVLTEAQVRRLWDLDSDTTTVVLATLLKRRFLARTASGHCVLARFQLPFARPSGGPSTTDHTAALRRDCRT